MLENRLKISEHRMKKSLLLSLVCLLSPVVAGADECADGCAIGEVGAGYSVYSPVPPEEVKMIQQAPRLDSLAGKTIALVGGSFMAKVTHPELKRLILKEFPTAKVYVLSEVGSAGPFPGPGMRSERREAFERKLKELGWMPWYPAMVGVAYAAPRRRGTAVWRNTWGCLRS